MVPTPELRSDLDFWWVRVEVGRQGSHDFVIEESRWRDGVNDSADDLLGLLIR